MWIYEANAIHLAAKFMPQGLELLLSSLEDNSRLIGTKSLYECAPLHVAAKNNDSLSTRYPIKPLTTLSSNLIQNFASGLLLGAPRRIDLIYAWRPLVWLGLLWPWPHIYLGLWAF